MKIFYENEKIYKIPEQKTLNKIGNTILKYFKHSVLQTGVYLHFIDSAQMKKLNKQYLKKDKPTDVLSFPALGVWHNKPINKKNYLYDYDKSLKCVLLGDIFICVNVAREQAKEYKHSVNQEICELFIHGILHLIGFDHETENEQKLMEQHETLFISKLKNK